jgi:protein-S-isoprenylcysteine O-methyltransferase Ste14
MNLSPEAIYAGELAALVGGWILFGLIFFGRKLPPRDPARRRDRRSHLGMALQGAAYAFLWIFRRSIPEPGDHHAVQEGIRTIVDLALMGTSIAFAATAVRTLGRNWSLTARVTDSHELITRGPYAWVRHPIYSAMLGMLLATGIGVSRVPAVAAAFAVAAAGATIRFRLEEKLLRETFGAAYDAYARRVPALLPRPPRG